MSAIQSTRYTNLSGQFINGGWRSGALGKTARDVNPYNGEVLLAIRLAGAGDVDEAMAAARRAQPDWAAAPAARQAEITLM